MGADLGQAQDYTALAILEHVWGQWAIDGGILDVRSYEPAEMRYNLVHLERLQLGMPYPRQVEIIKQRFEGIPRSHKHSTVSLLVDATGVGRAVLDMMRAAGLPSIPIVITGGNNVTVGEGGALHVPKRDLVGALQVLMQGGRLKVAQGLAEGPTLVRELQNFRYKISMAGNDTYSAWREAEHDDLVLSCALSAWQALRYSRVSRGA